MKFVFYLSPFWKLISFSYWRKNNFWFHINKYNTDYLRLSHLSFSESLAFYKVQFRSTGFLWGWTLYHKDVFFMKKNIKISHFCKYHQNSLLRSFPGHWKGPVWVLGLETSLLGKSSPTPEYCSQILSSVTKLHVWKDTPVVHSFIRPQRPAGLLSWDNSCGWQLNLWVFGWERVWHGWSDGWVRDWFNVCVITAWRLS